MASHRRPKQPSRARVTVFGATAAATVALSSQAAQAAETKEQVQERVDQLHEEAAIATEEYNGAKEREGQLQDEVETLQDSAARGQEELNELRSGLGSIAAAQYRTGGLDPSVQLFLSGDPDAYLERASTLNQITGKQAETLQLIEAKQRTLAQQREEATEKLAELEDTRDELKDRKDTIQGKLNEAQSLLNQLTEEERAAIAAAEAEEAAAAQAEAERANRSGSDGRPVLDGSGSSRGQAALAAGATKVGSPYVWGATGPNSFDCSGFTTWSFAQAGVQLPRTSQAQANAGMRVSESQLAPGDIVLFYGDLHHVGIYAGNGQVLHSPGTGKYVEYTGLHTMPFQFGVRVG
ncbi:NlpC/P60 family protein [Streptomyces sp. NPDC059853]|uniref:C40 family peptidase n=1 Tax=Streptomyces sp. NPDC059853 TaxID=3346973 RepID=UPI00364E8FE7